MEIERKNTNNKPFLSAVTIGHVDVGKSTAIGHLLKELKVLSEDEYKEIYNRA